MSQRARDYFNTYATKNESRYLSVGKWLFGFTWAEESWTWITDREKELTAWFLIGKMRDMQGRTSYHIVLGKLSIIFGY